MIALATLNMNNTSQFSQATARPKLSKAIGIKPKYQDRYHVSTSPSSEDGKSLTPHEMKRRAQNRASQRAFRERRRTQAETLQNQVNELQQRHEEILGLFHNKEEEVSALYDKIRGLQYKIQLLKAQGSSPQPLMSSTSFQFDPVVLEDTFDRWSTAQFETPTEWGAQSQHTQQYFDEQPLMSMEFDGSDR